MRLTIENITQAGHFSLKSLFQVLMLELALVGESLTEQWGQLQHHLDSALCLTTFFKSSFL